jgi:hypothetical protein
MGLDLTVLPNRYYDHPRLGDGYNRLAFWRDSELFDAIQKLPSSPLKPEQNFAFYKEEGLDYSKTDAYGKPLQYVEAEQFANIHSDNAWNEAVLAFLRSLPSKMSVVLYWH